MAQGHRYIAGLTICLLLWTQDAFAHPQFLQVDGGETAFVVDPEADKAEWVMDDCKRPLPIQSSTNGLMVSDEIVDIVDMAGRQVELRQQFRFDMASGVSVEVYNSVRGGWSPVPVRVETTCHQSAKCRARMELPPCSGS